MEIELEVRRVESQKRITSTKIRHVFSSELVYLDDFTITIPVYGFKDKEYEYTGSIFSRTKDLLGKIGGKGVLGVLYEDRMEVLKGLDRPILRCLYKDGDLIRICSLRRLVVVEPRSSVANVTFTRMVLQDQSKFAALKKLRMVNCNIKKIPDLSMMKLTHLDLSHNNISGVVYVCGQFNTVNLSHNKITRVIRMKASNLDISYNEITRFFQESTYQNLNLSHNPLEHYNAEARVLNLSHTMLKSLESQITKKLIVDGTKEIRLGTFENLVFLSVNFCSLRLLSFNARKLRVLKARNNFIEEVPFFPFLEYLDISGNLIHGIASKGVRFLDASKNQIMVFNLAKWKNLEHLNLSYNPLVSLENYGEMELKFLNLKGTNVIKDFRGNRIEKNVHKCLEKKKEIERFIVHPKGINGRLLVISMGDFEAGVFEILETIQVRIQETSNSYEYFQKFCSLLRKMIFARGARIGYALCMVTPKHVILNGRGIEVVFSNFAEIKILEGPDVVEVYDNIGNWHFIPLFCSFKGSIARFDILDTVRNDLDLVLDFIGHQCPLSAVMAISNTSKLPKNSKASVELISRIDLPSKISYETVIRSILRKKGNENGVQGSENYNFARKSSTRQFYGTLLLNPNPIFAFCKLIPKDTSYRYVIGNVMNIMRMMSNVFSGTRIEFFSRIWIVAFHDRVEACLWGIRIQEMLRCLGIDVGIGITCGTFYTRIMNNHVRFYGPVLNKASRIANLGIGVFCCHCVWTKHSKIMYISQGRRIFRGFKEPHLIYTPQLSEKT
ncbi:hypothetical protein GPK93_02g02200 [Encephalitozoon intestinalis]|nr:hypothetical protein GPK93_02g02200 [Encephalitozoon intestinalis]